MATLQIRPSGHYRVSFYFANKRHFASLKTKDETKANRQLAFVEETLHDLERGKLELPQGADIARFVISGGKMTARSTYIKPITLKDLFERYVKDLPKGKKEATTRYTEEIHMNHLLRHFGEKSSVTNLTDPKVLQGYVRKRAEKVSHATAKKELVTLAYVWNRYAVPMGIVTGTLPLRAIHFEKKRMKAPFQTRDEIERRIERGGLTADEVSDLWEALYLNRKEIEEVLAYVSKAATEAYLPVMMRLIAKTGMRRSEALRAEVDDVDFGSGTMKIREKKRVHGSEMSYRTVPLVADLKAALEGWLKREHPGGKYLIAKEKNETITPNVASKALRTTLELSEKWRVLHGFHVLRHSFISLCVCSGVSQRFIDTWVGHSTEEMRRRYSHLYPSSQKEAIDRVFNSEK
jgi:integrase